jgi:hypothetical protein
MTWQEFKNEVESYGVTGNDVVEFIDINGWEELVVVIERTPKGESQFSVTSTF